MSWWLFLVVGWLVAAVWVASGVPVVRFLREGRLANRAGSLPDPETWPTVSVVVPAFNEEGNVELLAQKFDETFKKAGFSAEVVFVEVRDGGRTRELNARLSDGLPEIPRSATEGAPFLPHISIARFTSDEGLGELKAALAELRSEGPGPTFPVRRIEFVKVWLSEETPEFDTLATYSLAQEPSGERPG